MSRSVYIGGQYFTCRQRDSVGIWAIENWDRLFAEELSAAESQFKETAGREITATVVVFGEVGALSSEMQDHITEPWSALAQAVDIEKAEYVANGIAAIAVTTNVDAPGVELDSFESEYEPLE